MTSDVLGHLLETRLDWYELQQDGIIKDDTKLAPRIQNVASKLELQMNKDAVGHLLESRPEYFDLVDAGIIRDFGVAP